MDFIRNLQLAAATSIADLGLLGGFMVVSIGKEWLDRNVVPSIPGGATVNMLGGSAINAAADLSKFILYDLATRHDGISAASVG